MSAAPLQPPLGSQAVVALLRRAAEARLHQQVDVRVVADLDGRVQHVASSVGAADADVAGLVDGPPGDCGTVVRHGTTGGVVVVAARTGAAADWSCVEEDLNGAAEVHAAMLDDARALDALRQDVADLTDAMRTRAVIDQAIGVVMARRRCTAEDAMTVLRAASQRRSERLSALAERVVAQASGAAPSPGQPFVPRSQSPAEPSRS